MKITSYNFIKIVAVAAANVNEVGKIFKQDYFSHLPERNWRFMKQLGEKIKEAREILSLSQEALAEKVEVSQRSIASYETGSVIPRGMTLKRLARVLGVSVDYLMDEQNEDPKSGMQKDPYFENIRETYGAQSEAEAKNLLRKNMALFAGGSLSQEAKDAFFEAVMTAYVTCKEEARRIYGPGRDERGEKS